MKNLIPKSFGRKRRVVAISLTITVAAALGILIYQGTKHTVLLTLNGQTQTVSTHARTVHDMLKELEITVQAEDYLHPSKESEVNNNLAVTWEKAKPVHIDLNDEKKEIMTTAKTVEELLHMQKIDITKWDKVNPSLETELQENMKIAIEKAFPLKLEVGGIEKQVWSTSTTVADFLKQQDVKLNKWDRVEPKLSEKVQAKNKITVIRVEKVTDVVEEPVQFAVITKEDENMDKGKKKILANGKDGLVSRQYEVVKENGKEVKRSLVSEAVRTKKKDKVVAVGTKRKITQVSHESNEGKVLYVSSTAYTASCNGCSGRTATGINLKQNPGAKVIAVDPRVIPLGSKVYVEGYGYAIAGDKGGAIKGNKIDVFFASKSDAYRWGVKKVKIRVVN
ncbi:ubiquitin-like domain-containing protein [Peribacillus sp. FSL H8-0477]|uniref:ubiquitin-like domain-containing protein n=1 Tax=Peribacillus sp. FSL H8-0477 TaxID=2921388 RepID=UPI0030F5939D